MTNGQWLEKKMTKEELKKEAEEKGFEYIPKSKSNELARFSRKGYVDGYIDGAEPREKRIEELEQQIEKMKCCQNCKNEGDYKEPYRYGTGWCNICTRHKVAKGNFDKWEIKENE